MANDYQVDPNYWTKIPGIQTLLSGGLGGPDYDPNQYTQGTMSYLQRIASGAEDQKLTSPMKYLTPMLNQARQTASTAKTSALEGLSAKEGAAMDPAMRAYFGSVLDTLPAKALPGMGLAASSAASQENAPIIAANSAAKTAAMQGLTNLAGMNANAAAEMAGLKYQTRNAALTAGISALVNLITQQMATMGNLMPEYTLSSLRGAEREQVSGKIPPGQDPYAWLRGLAQLS